jgi:hypothetical protein
MRALTGSRLFTGEAMLDGFSLIIDGERIAGLVPDDQIRPIRILGAAGQFCWWI